VKTVEFILNTSYSRSLGTSPFAVIHATIPRTPLLADLLPIQSRRNDPLSHSQSIVSAFATIKANVLRIQSNLFDKSYHDYAKHAHGRTAFSPGEFVLIHFPRKSKLHLEWQGPFLVVGKDVGSIYIVETIHDHYRMRIPASRLHVFLTGSLTHDQLIAESNKQDEFVAESVIDHRFSNGNLEFFIKWIGLPLANKDDPESWFSFAECRFCPPVRDYMSRHNLCPPPRSAFL